MKNMKKLAALALAGVMALSMAACGSTGTSSSGTSTDDSTTTESTSGDLRTVKLAMNAFIGVAPEYIGIEKGFFKEHGLDVQIVEFNNTSESVSAVIAGKADIAGGTLDALMLAADQNRDNMINIIALQDDSEGADGIVAKEGISSVADLKGHTVGVDIGQTSNLLLDHALEENGMTEDDIQLVDMTSSDAGASFISGQIDAAVTWEPYLSNASASGVGSMIYSSAEAPGLILDCLAVSQDSVNAEDSAWITEFIDAFQESLDYINDPANEDDAFTIIAGQLGVDKEEAQAEFKTVHIYTKDEMKTALSEGGTAYDTLSTVNDFYVSRGNMSAAIDGAEVFNPDFVK